MSQKSGKEFQRMKTEMGCSVIKQLVSLDIGNRLSLLILMPLDVKNKVVNGCTDLCIIPHGRKLQDIRLNCRQCEIESVYVNDVFC